MLQTGQSLLATALIHLHLGRGSCPFDFPSASLTFSRLAAASHPVYTADYSTYVQILMWFFDSPSPLSPFSVHRMALAGKELGKDVGQWFGLSTAAGAIKCVNDNALIIRSVVDLSSEPLSITSQKRRLASPSPSVRSFRPMYTQPPTRPPAHLESSTTQASRTTPSYR
jgi:hypothetical protein